jgi:SepF-like predicted cell division protein (DUF552 family)
MKWIDTSEIVAGLVLSGQINSHHVDPTNLYPPYGSVITAVRDGGGATEIIEQIGLDALVACKNAASTTAALQDVEWTELLRKASRREQLAAELQKYGKDLKAGNEIDVPKAVARLLSIYESGDRYVTLDKVDPQSVVWVDTDYKPLDEHFGGIPDQNLTIVAGPPGTGKSSFLIKIMAKRAKKKKKSLLYTFEMTFGQVVHRLIEIEMGATSEDRRHIIATADIMSVDEVYAEASQQVKEDNISLIGIDFADMMSEVQDDEQSVAHIYRTCARLAKVTGVPVILLSQLNRSYVGGVPRIHHIRWSGLAESMAAMIMLLYNPGLTWTDYGKGNAALPIVKNTGYIIGGKSRYGFAEGNMGAIHLPWDGAAAWGDESLDYKFLSNS